MLPSCGITKLLIYGVLCILAFCSVPGPSATDSVLINAGSSSTFFLSSPTPAAGRVTEKHTYSSNTANLPLVHHSTRPLHFLPHFGPSNGETMGGTNAAPSIKEEGSKQGRANNGKTSFMETGSDWKVGLEKIVQVEGTGDYIVIVDALTILRHEHFRLETKEPRWLDDEAEANVKDSVANHDKTFLLARQATIRSILGPKTVIVYVFDSFLRPEAKREELEDRAKRQARKEAKESARACGKKASELLKLGGKPTWMQSMEEADLTFVLEAHDEADPLIGYLLSQSHATPSFPAPDHEHSATRQISRVLDLAKAFPANRRILNSRDTDLTLCNVSTDVGWFLWTEWDGELDALELDVPGMAHPSSTAGPTTTTATAAAAAHHNTSSAASALARYRADVDSVPVRVSKGEKGPQSQAARLHAGVNLHRRRHLHDALQSTCVRTQRSTLKELPTRHGNFILLKATGLDALPGFGSDRATRIRAWAVVGTDYLRGGVPGMTPHVIKSGIIDEFLSHPFNPATLQQDLLRLVGDMTSQTAVSKAWRKSGAYTVAKSRDVKIADDLGARIYEAYRIGAGMAAKAYIDVRKLRITDGKALSYGDALSLADRARKRPATSNRARAIRPFAQRPPKTATPGRQDLVTSMTDSKRHNPQQPRHPNEDVWAAKKPMKGRLRPRGKGESLVEAAKDYGPEAPDVTADALEAAAQTQAKRDAIQANQASTSKQFADAKEARRLKRLEAGLMDDEDELHDDYDDNDGNYGGRGAPRKARTELKRLADVYETVTSPKQPISAWCRNFSASGQVAPVPAGAAAPPAVKPKRHRSGAQQRAARTRRLVSPVKSEPAGNSRKREANERSPAEESPPAFPSNVASLEPVARLWWLAVQMATSRIQSAYGYLQTIRLDRGEAGIKAATGAALVRNGIARELASLTQTSVGSIPGVKMGSVTADARRAMQACRDAGIPDPPRAPKEAYEQAFLPLQTNIRATPEQWLLDDLFKIGAFVASPDFESNAEFVLGFVLHLPHRDFSLAPSTKGLLDRVGQVPAASSRIWTDVGKFIGDVLQNAPFSLEDAAAGAEDREDAQLAKRPRESQRSSAKKSTEASKRREAGMDRLVDSDDETDFIRQPSTASTFLTREKVGELTEIIKKAVAALKRAEKKTPTGHEDVPDEEVARLRDKILDFIFRVKAFRDRHFMIAMTLSGCRRPDDSAGISPEQLMSGHEGLSAQKFSKALLALTMQLRRMLDRPEQEKLPFFDPDYIGVRIADLLSLSNPAYLPLFVRDLEVATTEAIHQILPLLQSVDEHRAEVTCGIKRLFDLVDGNGNAVSWRQAERTGARAHADPTAMASIVDLRTRLRPDMKSRAEAVVPQVQQVLGITTSPTKHLSEQHSAVEITNILVRRGILPSNLVPTGFLRISSDYMNLFCLKLTAVQDKYLSDAKDIDAGLFWSKIAQGDWTQLKMADYFKDLKPAYEYWRDANGTASRRPIPLVAELGEDRMHQHRPQQQEQPQATQEQLQAQAAASRRAVRLSRADTRRAHASRRLGQRSVRPCQLTSPIHKAQKQESTEQGLPKSWKNLRYETTREALDAFVKGVKPGDIAYCGVDLGLVNPISSYMSIPSEWPDVEDGRAEATYTYGRGALKKIDSSHDARLSHIGSNIDSQVNEERPTVQKAKVPPAAPPPKADVGRPRSSSVPPPPRDNAALPAPQPRYFANGSPTRKCPTPPPDPVGPIVDKGKPIRATWLHLLRKANRVRTRLQYRHEVEREAEMQAVVSEWVDQLAGGDEVRTREQLGRMRWVMFIGADMTARGGNTGAPSHNTLMRLVPAEMRRRGMPAMFVRVPEFETSQHCGHPRCTNDDEERSKANTMSRQDGSVEYRLLRCERCDCIFNRDGVASANILAMGLCIWQTGRQLWGERVRTG